MEEHEFQNQFTKILVQIIVGLVGAFAAQLLRTDYGMLGVLVIVMFYVMRDNRFYQIAAGIILFIENMSAWFAFLPILAYNGKRGLNLKWVFYIFYPAHLLVLYGICCLMGIGAIPAI